MVPPNGKGRVVSVVEEGDYDIKAPLVEVELEGSVEVYSLAHDWPIRQARPYKHKLTLD